MPHVTNPQRGVRVSAHVLCLERGRALLTRRRGSHGLAWTLPGGPLDFGEGPADAARREVLQSTGFVVEVGALLGVDSSRGSGTAPIGRRGPTDLHLLKVVYAARVMGNLVVDDVTAWGSGAEWVDLGSLMDGRRVELVDTALAWAWSAVPV
ncbi:NUDIX domain-containing protein [Cellulomonas cellasea]|uniref:NUDIX domain-containing protein n=1 Tax=Cellulomonas cellasea TaxID=43670 RepID=UPI0025A457FB|nr:NUDIX domain-containing protein [Cellulomonas cellasea]MDM8084995.1 NUDIX domain-containing protein [Cellulomonas cellasea]